MDYVETNFRAAGDCYRRAEQHLAEAETSLRKLLAKFLVDEIAKPAPAPVKEAPPRREPPEIWGRVDELLAARRKKTEKKPEPVVS
jgi:hypothetical protein